MVKDFLDSVIIEMNECENYLEVSMETIFATLNEDPLKKARAASKKKSPKKNMNSFINSRRYSEVFTKAGNKIIHLKSLRLGFEKELESNSITAIATTQMTNYVSLVLRFMNDKLVKAKEMHLKFSSLWESYPNENLSSKEKHFHPTELSKYYTDQLEDLLMWYKLRADQFSIPTKETTGETPLLADTAYEKFLFIKYSGLLDLMRKKIIKKNGSEHRTNIAKAVAYITGEEFSNVNSYLSDLIDDGKITTNNKNLYKEPNLIKVSDTMKSFGLSTADVEEKLEKIKKGTKD